MDSIQGIEASLATQGIYQQDSSQLTPMETDAEADQSEVGRVESVVASRVGLWPLFEQVALCAEQVAVNHLLALKIQGYVCKTSHTERICPCFDEVTNCIT